MKNRLLSFVVEGLTIKKDPNSDFTNLISGTSSYYIARFLFDSSWKDMKKVAVFRSASVTKYVPIIGNICAIPDEVTASLIYRVSVIGKTEDTTVQTKEVVIRQSKGGSHG